MSTTVVRDVVSGPFALWHHVFQGPNNAWFNDARIISGNFFIGLQGQSTQIFGDTGIPPGAIIESATMRVTAVSNRAVPHTTQINTPNRDPTILQKRPFQSPSQPFRGWRPAAWDNMDCHIQNVALGTIIETSTGVNNSEWLMRLLDATNAVGEMPLNERLVQHFEVPAGSDASRTLGRIGLQMRRSPVAPGGDVRIEMMDTFLDGGVRVPDEFVIATSDPVPMSALTTAPAGALVNFSFSGADQILMAAASNLAVVVRPDPYPVNFTNWISVRHRNLFLSVGRQQHYGFGTGMDYGNHPGTVDANQNSIVGSMGVNIPWAVPPFVAGVSYTTPDISALVQVQVDSPFYGSDRALSFNTSGTSGNSVRIWASYTHATFAPPQLTVTYRVPVDLSVDGGILFCVQAEDAPEPVVLPSTTDVVEVCVEPEPDADPTAPPRSHPVVKF